MRTHLLLHGVAVAPAAEAMARAASATVVVAAAAMAPVREAVAEGVMEAATEGVVAEGVTEAATEGVVAYLCEAGRAGTCIVVRNRRSRCQRDTRR